MGATQVWDMDRKLLQAHAMQQVSMCMTMLCLAPVLHCLHAVYMCLCMLSAHMCSQSIFTGQVGLIDACDLPPCFAACPCQVNSTHIVRRPANAEPGCIHRASSGAQVAAYVSDPATLLRAMDMDQFLALAPVTSSGAHPSEGMLLGHQVSRKALRKFK